MRHGGRGLQALRVAWEAAREGLDRCIVVGTVVHAHMAILGGREEQGAIRQEGHRANSARVLLVLLQEPVYMRVRRVCVVSMTDGTRVPQVGYARGGWHINDAHVARVKANSQHVSNRVVGNSRRDVLCESV